MREVTTGDGFLTFFNEAFQDIYHSVSGAIEEAREKFVFPTKIPELANTGNVLILDVCFGIGYNSLIAINEARKVNPEVKIHILALENDEAILNKILEMNMQEYTDDYKDIQRAWKHHKEGKEQEGNVTIQFFVGDAREEICKVKEMADAVFLDPFTPKTCPELWEEQFIKDIAEKMKPGSILATYSCARKVRDNLAKAGLDVKEGPKVGRCAPSTFALKH